MTTDDPGHVSERPGRQRQRGTENMEVAGGGGGKVDRPIYQGVSPVSAATRRAVIKL